MKGQERQTSQCDAVHHIFSTSPLPFPFRVIPPARLPQKEKKGEVLFVLRRHHFMYDVLGLGDSPDPRLLHRAVRGTLCFDDFSGTIAAPT